MILIARLGAIGAVFKAYRELIEEVASETHDAEGPFDAHGRVHSADIAAKYHELATTEKIASLRFLGARSLWRAPCYDLRISARTCR